MAEWFVGDSELGWGCESEIRDGTAMPSRYYFRRQTWSSFRGETSTTPRNVIRRSNGLTRLLVITIVLQSNTQSCCIIRNVCSHLLIFAHICSWQSSSGSKISSLSRTTLQLYQVPRKLVQLAPSRRFHKPLHKLRSFGTTLLYGSISASSLPSII